MKIKQRYNEESIIIIIIHNYRFSTFLLKYRIHKKIHSWIFLRTTPQHSF